MGLPISSSGVKRRKKGRHRQARAACGRDLAESLKREVGATIDKYVGDAIVIFFGDPETRGVKEDALACVKMAIAMRQKMAELQGTWRDSGIANPLRCRIGINTGFCTVGNFGSEDRMDYTIIGSGVNLASRLESASAPGEILISYETYALVKDQIQCKKFGDITELKQREKELSEKSKSMEHLSSQIAKYLSPQI